MKIVLVVVVLVTCFAVDNCQVTPGFLPCINRLTTDFYGPCFINTNTTVSSRILHATQVLNPHYILISHHATIYVYMQGVNITEFCQLPCIDPAATVLQICSAPNQITDGKSLIIAIILNIKYSKIQNYIYMHACIIIFLYTRFGISICSAL